MKHIYYDILLVGKDLAWHHSSVATALWNGGFDVPLFAEVFFETKNVTSRVNRVTCTCYLPTRLKEYSYYRYVYIRQYMCNI